MCFHSSAHKSGYLAAILQFSPGEKGKAHSTLGRRMLGQRETPNRQEEGGESALSNPKVGKKQAEVGKSRISPLRVPEGRR